MLPELSKIKGMHPGAILKREIKLRGLKNYELADSVNEFPQTISAILKEKRGVTPKLSIKLGKEFSVDDDYFMLLQASYDVKNAAGSSSQMTPDLTKIRKVLFWDTDFDKIDWLKNKKAILKRIFERGNDTEIQEIITFYGKDEIRKVLIDVENNFLPSYNENLKKYNII
mgnify:CR=1 FL=1